MKFLPESQWRRLCLVKPGCDDGAVGTDGAHCRLKGVVTAAQFDRDVGARARRDVADRGGKLLVWDDGAPIPPSLAHLPPTPPPPAAPRPAGNGWGNRPVGKEAGRRARAFGGPPPRGDAVNGDHGRTVEN